MRSKLPRVWSAPIPTAAAPSARRSAWPCRTPTPRAALTKRVIVIVSDGEDNDSEISHTDVIQLAQESNVLIYAIGFYDVGTSPIVLQRASKELRRMARETGGKSFYPSRRGVQAVAEEIAREIRSQYVIGYYPKSTNVRNGRFHRIKVKLSGGVSASVRTRRGYYSQDAAPEPPPQAAITLGGDF